VQELSGESVTKTDRKPTKELQKMVLKHPGVWVIALSSAFLYITKDAIDSWGVLFLQEARGLTQWQASQALGYSVVFSIAGTLLAGWLSDKVFRGDRAKPALLSGILCTASLVMFLFVGGGFGLNIFYVSLFSFSMGVLYCVVAGLMAVDIVPRKATGAALGVVGISSYIASGLQDITSGYMIQYNSAEVISAAGEVDKVYNFGPVAWFWITASIIAFVLPILNWKKMKENTII
jgi:OPA family sugar phosphate sensor protein UhpC-like MFS transporter